MVKLAKNKTSKLLLRGKSPGIGRTPSFITEPIAQQGQQLPGVKVLTTQPTEPHIVFMSENSARGYNCEGSVVISIDSPGAHRGRKPTFPKALDVLYLEFNPVFEQSGWFQTEHRDAVKNFLCNNLQTQNIIVHCGQGQYRSRAVALGIFDAYTEEDLPDSERIGVYRYSMGRWTDASTKNHNDYNRGCERTHFGVYRAVTKALYDGTLPQNAGQRFLTQKAALALGTTDGFDQTPSVL